MWITIIIGAAGNSNMHYQMDLRIHKSLLSLSLYAIALLYNSYNSDVYCHSSN